MLSQIGAPIPLIRVFACSNSTEETTAAGVLDPLLRKSLLLIAVVFWRLPLLA